MSSYKVLARKWRPQNFADMIGQQHVLRALINALDNQRIHHAYLFTGMRGVGKTTIARIFAKCLNCETKGVSSEPCGTCSACQDIDAGRFFDLIEVDAASRTKVDETRELLENVPYAPASGRYKVYLIDEVHMFSTHSFNALLKTLEEPPEHVKFLLATTDPQKVPVTVLSRCLQFNLKRMASTRLTDYLAQILDAESMAHDRPALELISRAADGSVRDALSLVEQAAAFGSGAVRAEDVESMLGRVSTQRLIELIAAVGESNAAALFERVDALAEYAPDYAQLLAEMLSILHRVAMIQSVPEAHNPAEAENDPLQSLANDISPEEVQLYYQIGQHARRDMPYASDQREAFDMALLRMIAFAPQSGAINAAPQTSGKSLSQGDVTGKPSAAPSTARSAKTATAASVKEASANAKAKAAPASAPEATKDAVSANSTHSDSKDNNSKKNSTGRQLAAAALAAANAPDPVTPSPSSQANSRSRGTSGTEPAASPPSVSQEVAPTDVNDASNDHSKHDVPTVPAAQAIEDSTPSVTSDTSDTVALDSLNTDNWADTVSRMGLSGMPRQLASHCVFHTREGDRIHLRIEADQAHLNTAQFSARLQSALSEHTRSDVSVSIELVTTSLNTPARIEEKRKADALSAARASIDADPMVKQLITSVDGVVDAKSVQPIEASQSDPD